MRVHALHHPLILIRADTSLADNRHTWQLLVFSLLWPDREDCIRRAWVIPFARSLARTGGFSPMPGLAAAPDGPQNQTESKPAIETTDVSIGADTHLETAHGRG